MSNITERTRVQEATVLIITEHRDRGATVADMREWLGVHHGTASGALSILHRNGRIARLAERRDGCKIYVVPQYVMGRTTETQGRAA